MEFNLSYTFSVSLDLIFLRIFLCHISVPLTTFSLYFVYLFAWSAYTGGAKPRRCYLPLVPHLNLRRAVDFPLVFDGLLSPELQQVHLPPPWCPNAHL